MSTHGRKRLDPLPLELIADRYAVERVLGRGGMATVYLCNDLTDGKRVAVKVLRQEIGSAVVIERFLREIDLSSNLDHPRIPRVLDSGVVGELPFYVMTYIEGESLRARLDREKQLSFDEAIRIAKEVTGPMTHAHRHGIVHRDIKPENIVLSADGVYVLDFGVARAIIESASDRLTSTGVAVGTPAYMSPEQALGDQDLDARSDIYSLGCVIYEMIVGLPPFVGVTSQAVMSRRFAAPAAPLHESREGVPEHIEHAVAKSLMKAPVDRWQTAEQFAAALTPPADSPTYRFATVMRRLRKRKHFVASVLAIPVIAGLALSIGAASGLLRSNTSGPPILDRRRIAVLYFDDHSVDRNLGYLANGLTESLIHELSSVPAIEVISRNGVKPFRDRATPMDSIANVLRVGSIVEGSVQRSGNRVRVTVQLVDAKNDRPLESATIEQDMGDLFRLEDDLAHEVAGMLRKRIGREIRVSETIAATSSNVARELVFRADKARNDAQVLFGGPDTSQLATGLALLRTADSLLARAESADPRWTGPTIDRGWTALEEALRQGGASRDSSFRRAWNHAQSAMSRKPNDAVALELRGTIQYYEAARLPLPDSVVKTTLRGAASDLERAISNDSTLATAWGTLGRTQMMQGDLDDAVSNAKRALQEDAYLRDAADVLVTLYGATVMRDSLDASWRWCLQGRRDFPHDPRFIECQLTLLAADLRRPPDPKRAWALVKEGDRLDPPSEARQRGRAFLPFYRVMLAAEVTARAGDRDGALAVAARTRAAVSGDSELTLDVMYQDAYIDLLLGDRQAAIKKLTVYHAARPSLSHLTLQHARWKPLLNDTGFVNMLRRAK
ncbi:MAG: protein kinase [Gemmatimonadaceae bacterium]